MIPDEDSRARVTPENADLTCRTYNARIAAYLAGDEGAAAAGYPRRLEPDHADMQAAHWLAKYVISKCSDPESQHDDPIAAGKRVAFGMVSANRDALDLVAGVLMTKDILTEADLTVLLGPKRKEP